MPISTPGSALWNQRAVLASRQDGLGRLVTAVGRPTDLCPFQWVQLMAFALEFRPDLILELGRGRGNSTCSFLEVADQLAPEPCRLVSLCLNDDWFRLTRPRVELLRPPEWFARGTFMQTDIRGCDPVPLLAGAKRCFVFWDAHGFELAEWVLGALLPRLAGMPHVIAMHDFCDVRYATPPRDYASCGLWAGENHGDTGFWLGHIFSRVPQAISVIDFTTRNRVPLYSADESLHAELAAEPDKLAELRRLLGDEFVSLQGQWFWFSLNEAAEALTFPARRQTSAPAAAGAPTLATAAGASVSTTTPHFARPLWRRLVGRGRRRVSAFLNRCLPAKSRSEAATAPHRSSAPPAAAPAHANGQPPEVWIDVGSHQGEKTFPAALANPELTVYAFEPNWQVAAPLLGRLPNYVMLPVAVAEVDGSAEFHRNRCSAASSLLPLNPAGVQAWQGGAALHVEQTLQVPTIRLDTFLERMHIAKVNCLKIDAQGAALMVVKSLGRRIADVERIELEVQTTRVPLYQGGSEKAQVLEFMAQAGFVLCAAEQQSCGQEENLCFARLADAEAARARGRPGAPAVPAAALATSESTCFVKAERSNPCRV